MTEYKMTDEYQKVLTEMIGEEWIEREEVLYSFIVNDIFYSKQYYPMVYKNRTFTTDADMMKVFRSLKTETWVDWFNFKNFAKIKWEKDFWARKEELREPFEYWWMSDSERFCCLVAQCKMEGVI